MVEIYVSVLQCDRYLEGLVSTIITSTVNQ